MVNMSKSVRESDVKLGPSFGLVCRICSNEVSHYFKKPIFAVPESNMVHVIESIVGPCHVDDEGSQFLCLLCFAQLSMIEKLDVQIASIEQLKCVRSDLCQDLKKKHLSRGPSHSGPILESLSIAASRDTETPESHGHDTITSSLVGEDVIKGTEDEHTVINSCLARASNTSCVFDSGVEEKIDKTITPYAERSHQTVTSWAERTDKTVTPCAEQTDKTVTPCAEQTDQTITPYAERTDKTVTPYAERTDQMVTSFAERTDQTVTPCAERLVPNSTADDWNHRIQERANSSSENRSDMSEAKLEAEIIGAMKEQMTARGLSQPSNLRHLTKTEIAGMWNDDILIGSSIQHEDLHQNGTGSGDSDCHFPVSLYQHGATQSESESMESTILDHESKSTDRNLESRMEVPEDGISTEVGDFTAQLHLSVTAEDEQRETNTPVKTHLGRPTCITSPFTCNHCQKVFSRKYNYKRHMTLHTGKEVHCDMCEKKFSEKSDLERHIQSKHRRPRFQCEVCLKYFSSRNIMEKHCQVHSANFSFTCEVCGRGFSYKSALVAHIDRHNGNKKHRCEECGKSFILASSCRDHYERCANKTEYRCDVCGKSFASRRYLYQHKKNHTDTDRYQCQTCGKVYQHATSLSQHREKKH